MSWNIAKPGDQINGPVSITGALTSSSTISGTQIISTVATGTAPLTVASTTNVTNLNADLLDGQQGSYYQSADNINAGTLVVSRGGTGASTFTAGRVLFGNGTSALNTSANLFWDNSNNRLGIGTATPTYPLSVNGRISYSGAIGEGADTTLSSSGTVLLHGNSSTWTEQRFYAAGNEQHRIASSGVFTWYDGGGAGGTRMTLNGTGLGVGVAPTERLTVWGGSNVYGDSRFNVGLFDPTSAALGTGSGISFGGYTNGVTVGATFAQIKGIKENGTAGNIAGAFAISTLPNGGIPTERLRIASDGVCTWSNVGGVVSNAMVLNGTGLGVGVVPTVGKLEVNLENGASNSAYFRTTTYTNLRIVGANGAATAGGCQAFFTTTGNRDWIIGQRTDTVYATANAFFIRDESASATRLTIDTSGNVGLGVTPSAFDAIFGRALQFNGGSIYSYSSTQLNLLHNIYFDGSSFKYVNTAPASSYRQVAGVHSWSVAASGTAGTGVSMTAAMTLDASGNLLVGTVSTGGKVHVRATDDQVLATGAVTGYTRFKAQIDSGAAVVLGAYQNYFGFIGTSTNHYLEIRTNDTERLRIKSTGQVNFVGQASDPAGAAAGDVYYNTTTNKLKCYNGTTWNDLF